MALIDVIDRLDSIGGDEYELSHLPDGEDRSFLEMVAVWGGAAFVPAALLIGGSVAGEISFPNFVFAFGIGFFLVSLVSILIGITARNFGLTFHVSSRYFFGNRGSVIPSGLLILTRIGFAAVELALAASFVSTAFGGGSELSFVVATVVLGCFYVASATVGIEGLKWVSYVAIPLVTVVFLYGAWTLGLGGTAAPVDNPIPFTTAIGIAASFWVAGAIVSGDWLRYARSRRAIVGSTWIALVVFTLFLVSLGFLSVFAAGTHSLSAAMANAGLAIPAALAMILLVWTTVDNWLYSGALGLSNVLGIRKVSGVLIVGAISIVVAGLKFHTLLLPYLSAIGILIPPVAAPWLIEYYLLDHRMSGVTMDDLDFNVNWLAVGAWAIGSAVAYVTPAVYVVPLVAIVASGVAYLVLYYGLRDTALYPLGDIARPSGRPAGTTGAD